jgi:hypothetical protein
MSALSANLPSVSIFIRRHVAGMERYLGLRRCGFGHPCHGDDVMDRNNRIGRRERFEILKIAQGLGEGVVAVDSVGPLRPNTILGALEESIARRTREGRIWPAFLDQFWIGRWVDGTDAHRADGSRPSRRT